MFSTLLGWLMKSKGIKIGGSVLGGSGLILLFMGLHTSVNGKINKQDADLKIYVGLVLEPVRTEITNLKKEMSETKTLVRDIHNYLLKSKEK